MLFLTLNTGVQCFHSFRDIGQLPTQICGGPAAGLRSRMLQVSCGEQQVSVPHNTHNMHTHMHAHHKKCQSCTEDKFSLVDRQRGGSVEMMAFDGFTLEAWDSGKLAVSQILRPLPSLTSA